MLIFYIWWELSSLWSQTFSAKVTTFSWVTKISPNEWFRLTKISPFKNSCPKKYFAHQDFYIKITYVLNQTLLVFFKGVLLKWLVYLCDIWYTQNSPMLKDSTISNEWINFTPFYLRHNICFLSVLNSLICFIILGVLQYGGTLSAETLSGESDEFFEKWRKFRPRNNLPAENFSRQSFFQQYNHTLSKWLKSLVASLALHFKTLMLLLGETFR